MRSLRHLLPSAGSLIVFEAAGRLSSFTAAGRELGMTQAAVSYAVRGVHVNCMQDSTSGTKSRPLSGSYEVAGQLRAPHAWGQISLV